MGSNPRQLRSEAPVNGGRNYNGPKVRLASLSKTEPYAGNSSYSRLVLVPRNRDSQNPADTGTIRREGSKMENPQRLYVQSQPQKLEAQWVVGFVDGEGCFFVGINPHLEMTCGFQVLPEFTVVQHQRDIQLLFALKKFFGCGVVRKNREERMAYRVRSLENLNQRIIPFFDQHPLKSRRRIDFLKFRKILQLMNRGEHLKPEGIQQIRAIASKMNRGRER
jgi:hypothetical protein